MYELTNGAIPSKIKCLVSRCIRSKKRLDVTVAGEPPCFPYIPERTVKPAKCEEMVVRAFFIEYTQSDAIYPLRQRAACSTANIQPFYSFAVSLVVWHAPHLLGSCVFAEDAFVIAFAIAMCDELLTFLFPAG